jgi:DNA-nicking Smr family endonuclease
MGTELDLHRMTVDEALPRVDDFLNDIYNSGLHYALIIHGKGTGVLRQEISRYLTGHPLVKSYRPADRFSGGFGATEVELITK